MVITGLSALQRACLLGHAKNIQEILNQPHKQFNSWSKSLANTSEKSHYDFPSPSTILILGPFHWRNCSWTTSPVLLMVMGKLDFQVMKQKLGLA